MSIFFKMKIKIHRNFERKTMKVKLILRISSENAPRANVDKESK